jgi:hypothetical protein
MNKNIKNFITIIVICLIVGLYFFGKKRNNKEIGYYCKTIKSGETFIIKAPIGTHFTKLIFADFGNPVSCPNPTYGTCTISKSNIIGFPFDVTKNTIDGKDVNGATFFGPIKINDFGNDCEGIINKYTTFKLEYTND